MASSFIFLQEVGRHLKFLYISSSMTNLSCSSDKVPYFFFKVFKSSSSIFSLVSLNQSLIVDLAIPVDSTSSKTDSPFLNLLIISLFVFSRVLLIKSQSFLFLTKDNNNTLSIYYTRLFNLLRY